MKRLFLRGGVFCRVILYAWISIVFGLVTFSLRPEPSLALAQESASTADEIRPLVGKVIGEIRYEGLKRIEGDAIGERIQSKKGSALSLETIRADIRSIFTLGYFNDIEVRAEPMEGSNQVRLLFLVKERPVISDLRFEGNEQVSTDDLQEVIKMKSWSILDVNLVREDVKLIQKHYEDKGFYLAKVDYEIKKTSKSDEVILTYKISDYEKVRIKKITFLNNKIFTDKQLKTVLAETQEGGLFSFLSGSGSFKDTAFRQDLQRLTLWYLDHGYVKFRYETPIVTVSEDKRWLYISVYLDEGDPYTMGDLDFSGDLLFSKDDLHSELTLKTDETFRITKRNADIQRLTEKYQDLGYAFVNVIPKMEFHDETKKVDITYHFEKGNLVYFGEIRVVGNAKTHDKVIRRELKVHEGELYNGTNLRLSKERVERLGYFQPGEVIFNEVTRKGRSDVLDLEISVKERSTGSVTLGAGYGSVQKFFLTTQVSEINLFGKGQTLRFSGQFAADRRSKSFSVSFTDPYAFDTLWSLGFDIYYVNYPIPTRYDMRKLGFNLRAGHPISDDINAYITYKNESLKVIEKSRSVVDESLDDGVLSSLIWSVVRDTRNNRFEPTGGSYQSVSLETAGIGGDKKFMKWIANNRFYWNITGDLVFRNNFQYGHAVKTSDRDVPNAERFYLGGPNDLKGFNLFALGPRKVHEDGFKEALGGHVEFFSLFEFEYPLIREAGLKMVTFFDAGNAFASFPGSDGEPFTIRSDVGFGLRWFSPIGPLRFEWGWPMARKAGEDSPVFSFYIGPPF